MTGKQLPLPIRILLFLLICASICMGSMDTEDTRNKLEPATALFFYSSDCATCHRMRIFLDRLVELNPGLSIEQLDIEEAPEAWQSACDAAGITAWGVPRLFVGDMVFADWRDREGELVYRPDYNGYLGYRSQIVAALEELAGFPLILPEDAE